MLSAHTLTLNMTTIPARLLPHAEGLGLPAFQSSGASGCDLMAALPEHETLVLEPGARALVPTGLVLQLPHGMEAQVRPRSGLALKHGVTVLNAPGTIDSDYRGEISVILINHGAEPFVIMRGLRIAQLIFCCILQPEIVSVTVIADTSRGSGGFGSTGI